MLAAVSAGNAFLSRLYHSHLFLSKQEAGDCSENGFKLMTSYLKLASIAYGLELTRFKIIPKLHILFHLVERLHWAFLGRSEGGCLNPISYSCQMDEDLVGQVCQWSRSQSIRVVHERTIRAYLVNFRLHLVNWGLGATKCTKGMTWDWAKMGQWRFCRENMSQWQVAIFSCN